MHVVFGAGPCALGHWRYIKKYFSPDAITCNSRSKWGSFRIDDLLVQSPREIFEGRQPGETLKVLIAIGDPDSIEEVKGQLEPYGAECLTIYEFAEAHWRTEPIPERLRQLEGERGRRALLFNTPEHDNIGDHLIAIAEKEFLRKILPEIPCVEITDVEYLWIHHWVRAHIRPDDLILYTGGGNLGSLYLYNGETTFRDILSEYPNHRIITFPQTVYFEENDRGAREKALSKTAYSAHKHLTITLRERNSCASVRDFPGVDIEVMPDIVFSLDYSGESGGMKSGEVTICIRKDKESTLSEEERRSLCDGLTAKGFHLSYTSMHTGAPVSLERREQVCTDKRREIMNAALVITDTLHCMISCVITGTPCIAFDTLSHKVKYIYDWIKDLPYIHLAQSPEDALRLVDTMAAMGKSVYPIHQTEPLFAPLVKQLKETERT